MDPGFKINNRAAKERAAPITPTVMRAAQVHAFRTAERGFSLAAPGRWNTGFMPTPYSPGPNTGKDIGGGLQAAPAAFQQGAKPILALRRQMGGQKEGWPFARQVGMIRHSWAFPHGS